MEPARFYEFGPFVLDTGNRSLLRDGERVPLQPKAYEVLLMLIENRTRLVTRNELMDSIWGGGVNVEEGALNYQIRQLRSALGDNASNPEYIRTSPKQGFQFIAPTRALSRVEETGGAISTPEQDRNASINLLDPDSDSEIARAVSFLKMLRSNFAGHALYVLGASTIFAAYFSIALLVEIAYQFDRYGGAGAWIALVILCVIFLGSLWCLSLGTKRTSSGKPGGLVLSASALVVVALAVVIGACGFLPAEPITEAEFQTYTAQAAYFKDFCYAVPLGVIFLVIPLHFVIGMERELRAQNSILAVNLLAGRKPSAAPRGTLYLRTWFLFMLLFAMAAYSAIARAHLFDNLKPGKYMSLFQSLIHIRMTLYFGLGTLCLIWYYGALNDLKRRCLVIERARSG